MAKQRFITGVTGIPINAQKQILLSQRNSPSHPAAHMKWQLIGGGIEFGETPEQTLAREFQEEAQLSVEILFPHPIVKRSVWPATADFDIASHITLISYLIGVPEDQTPNCENDEETHDVQWFSLEEAMQLECLPYTGEFITEAFLLAEKLKLFP